MSKSHAHHQPAVGRGMRRDLFGIARTPFTAAAPMYLDPPRQEACAQAENHLRRRGLACVRGAPGCGKTRFLRHVCGLLDERAVQIAYVPFAMFKDGDLLRAICRQFNLEPPFRKSAAARVLQEHAVSLGEAVNPVVVIDEVQLMDQAALEMLRVLGNHRFDSGNLFTMLLCGGDDFARRLGLRVNEPLRQRVGACWRMEPFDRQHTAGYIQHHIRHAGAEHEIFDPQALNRVFDETRGVPRLVDSLAAAAMEAASAAGAARVALEHIDRAMRNMPGRKEDAAHDPDAF
jgi:type II secretory pathway predicted ATPase ExeA